MARFLMGSMPMAGHVGPGLPVARELVKRGHEVWWYTGKRYQSKVEATGAHYVPMKHGYDFDGEDTETYFPGSKGLTGLRALKFGLTQIFCECAVGYLKDYEEILKEFPADVLLSDLAFLAPGMLQKRDKKLPWAVYGITALNLTSRDTAPFGLGLLPADSAAGRARNRLLHMLVNKVVFRDVNKYHNQVRARVGLPATKNSIFDEAASPFLYLQGSSPAFEYPLSDLPEQVHFVGPFLPEPPADFTPPGWWDMLQSGRPVIHVTQGTVTTGADDLLIPTIKALADENVLVVATTGGKPVESIGLDPLPTNVRVEKFIPHYHLLPYVDVMVTNGGYNGVQIALANGVPLVAAGMTEEKPEVCNRIAWAGAGINLKTKTPTPEQVREAVKTILSNSSYREKAQAIKADYARYNASQMSADLLEQLAETRQPVLKKTASQREVAKI